MYDFLIIDITQMNFVARKDGTLEHCWIVQALFYKDFSCSADIVLENQF